jgi:hypothetical protein
MKKEFFGKENGSLFSSIEEKIANKYKFDKNYLEYGILAFKAYPSLTSAVVISVLIGILIPIFSFILCSYRLCCKPKFNPFDGKFDSIKRKANATFIFVLLVALL